MSSVYQTEVKTIDGEAKPMSDFKGKALLIVNVASKCGLTSQYEQLEALYKERQSEGLEVLGFPCNQFAGQEPGSEEEIKEFCRATFGVEFPMFSKIEVNGPGRHPLYQVLIDEQPKVLKVEGGQLEGRLREKGLAGENEDDVMWNFEKFLVNREGKVVARFAPDMTVENPTLQDELNKVL